MQFKGSPMFLRNILLSSSDSKSKPREKLAEAGRK
jgi:hypothetical protein